MPEFQLPLHQLIKCPKCDCFINYTQLKNDNCWSCGEDIAILKNDVQDDKTQESKIGLEFINKLRPITQVEEESAETNPKATLSKKYKVLGLYKVLAFLLMIAATGFFIYSLVQYIEAPKAARKILENAIITSTVSYFITMFSLFCLTKMIDFLFELDKNKSDK